MTKPTLYLECASGISGDMTVAALLDLGASQDKLLKVLHSLELGGADIAIARKSSHGIAGTDFDVRLPAPEPASHEHRLHGHGHEHGAHESHHDHGNGHGHIHRHLGDICRIIDAGRMSSRARDLAKKIFQIVAEAEAQAHGIPVEEVHFHEVGAVDSIVDIVAAAVCIDDLDIGGCVVRGLTEGTGTVMCQHGELPVPVPAVANIAEVHRLPLRIREDVTGEMVTPTGIAIAAALRTSARLPPRFVIQKTGIGLGKREFGHPNILRAMLIQEQGEELAAPPSEITVIETNIDDATGETLGFALDKLLREGALDVHYVPCFMKKDRPGWLLRVLAAHEDVPRLERVIFRETTAIGVRRLRMERTCMDRKLVPAALPEGEVMVKVCTLDGITRCHPEYESVRAAAEKSGRPFLEIYEAALQAVRL